MSRRGTAGNMAHMVKRSGGICHAVPILYLLDAPHFRIKSKARLLTIVAGTSYLQEQGQHTNPGPHHTYSDTRTRKRLSWTPIQHMMIQGTHNDMGAFTANSVHKNRAPPTRGILASRKFAQSTRGPAHVQCMHGGCNSLLHCTQIDHPC